MSRRILIRIIFKTTPRCQALKRNITKLWQVFGGPARILDKKCVDDCAGLLRVPRPQGAGGARDSRKSGALERRHEAPWSV